MQLTFKINVFEGPMDLLLHLIDKNKINIYDIPIVDLTNQYIEYMDTMIEPDMDTMSSFIEMAATLFSIKAKMLLPKRREEVEVIDPRLELVQKLLEYKQFKAFSKVLEDKQYLSGKVFFKGSTLPTHILDYKREVEASELLNATSMDELYKMFKYLIDRVEKKVDPVRSRFGEIKRERFSIEEKLDYIRFRLNDIDRLKFFQLFEDDLTKEEIVTTFLATLQLIKNGEIVIIQNNTFEDFDIMKGNL